MLKPLVPKGKKKSEQQCKTYRNNDYYCTIIERGIILTKLKTINYVTFNGN